MTSDLSTPPICTSGSDIKHKIFRTEDSMHSMFVCLQILKKILILRKFF